MRYNAFFIFAFVVVLVLCLQFGATGLSLVSLFDARNTEAATLIELRLQRALCAALVGAILGLTGATLQRLLNNPLADPFVLGISSGGTTAAIVYTLAGLPVVSAFLPLRALVALAGCLATLALLLLARRLIRGYEEGYLIAVLGLILNSFFGATILIVFAMNGEPASAEAYRWLIGSLQDTSWFELALIGFLAACAATVLLRVARSVMALSFGEATALTLGFDVRKVFGVTLLCSATLIACAVSLAGSVGFVGLIVPHIAVRLFRHESFASQWAAAAWLGALALMISDLLSRTLLAPIELPVGVFTASIGVPAFVLLVVGSARKRGRHAA